MSDPLEASYAYACRLSRQTAHNFYYAFYTLPRPKHRAMCALYAFLRVSDDLGDDGDWPPAERRQLLADWRASLTNALAGQTDGHPVFPALIDTVTRYRIPPEHLFAVLDGIESDLEAVRFETFDDLQRYCYLVAGVVGLCCVQIWGVRGDPMQIRQRSVDCGLAFQLTNILRDLQEDAARGRVYLPAEDLRQFDYTANDIRLGCRDERFGRLMAFEVARAESCFRQAAELFENLDPGSHAVFDAMLRLYGGLLREIKRRNYDVYSRRVKLSRWRKMMIPVQSLWRHSRLVSTGQ